MPARPIILLTGFGPFPGVGNNATAILVPRLAEAAHARFKTHRVVGEVLPTDWEAAPERLARLFDGADIALALHFGVSHAAEGFQIELRGRNKREAKYDVAGGLPATHSVIEGGAPFLAASVPAQRVRAALLRLGVPCRTSNDAGSYLCNALLYHSLHLAQQAPRPFLAGFVHVPAGLIGHGEDGQAPHPDCPLDWNATVTGGLEIIAVSLETAAAQAAVKTG